MTLVTLWHLQCENKLLISTWGNYVAKNLIISNSVTTISPCFPLLRIVRPLHRTYFLHSLVICAFFSAFNPQIRTDNAQFLKFDFLSVHSLICFCFCFSFFGQFFISWTSVGSTIKNRLSGWHRLPLDVGLFFVYRQYNWCGCGRGVALAILFFVLALLGFFYSRDVSWQVIGKLLEARELLRDAYFMFLAGRLCDMKQHPGMTFNHCSLRDCCWITIF